MRKIILLIFSILLVVLFITFLGCSDKTQQGRITISSLQPNVLDYTSNPSDSRDKSSLVFSDQGAWFGYGFQAQMKNSAGFSGPFLMTQDNGRWCSNSLSKLILRDGISNALYNWDSLTISQNGYPSHMEQVTMNKDIELNQKLVFISQHSAMIISEITNVSDDELIIQPSWEGDIFPIGIKLTKDRFRIKMTFERSDATGYISIPDSSIQTIDIYENGYKIFINDIVIKSGDSKQLILVQTFIFPENNVISELERVNKISERPHELISDRVVEKQSQLSSLSGCYNDKFPESIYSDLMVKCMLTLQNNWRAPAGELKHSGLFPSYHYEWFNGFWAWDSWKHSAALAQYYPELAKGQLLAMYDFMDEYGFIADCIYRDTSIENHNYRNTKPPLSAWAAWQIFDNDKDTSFLRGIYPKLVMQHNWWYSFRDNDGDSICEYGSTDGTIIAAKWESGMDNAVRFDNSKLLKNSESAYSLNQESIDLNSYLYAEKQFLMLIANVLDRSDEAKDYLIDGKILKIKIQNQFYDPKSGWFFDTSIDGNEFINVMGCEGWIPLWASVATGQQAHEVMINIMDTSKFNKKVPLQTLSADNSEFKPEGGYWRGPTWLDQAYFGVKGLRNYGYNKEADELTLKIINNAEGVMDKGMSIRENYNPITGKGLEAENFSWSAANYILLLKNNEWKQVFNEDAMKY